MVSREEVSKMECFSLRAHGHNHHHYQDHPSDDKMVLFEKTFAFFLVSEIIDFWPLKTLASLASLQERVSRQGAKSAKEKERSRGSFSFDMVEEF